jgi:hypothetical protein
MNPLPHTEIYKGASGTTAMINDISGDISADCWSVCVSPKMSKSDCSEMWKTCLGENEHCRDNKTRQGCSENHEIVFYNTSPFFINGETFASLHQNPTPEYTRQGEIGKTLACEGGVERFLLPHLMAGKILILNFGGPSQFRVSVFEKIEDTFGGSVFIQYTMYKTNFKCPTQETTPDALNFPFNNNPRPNLVYRVASQEDSEATYSDLIMKISTIIANSIKLHKPPGLARDDLWDDVINTVDTMLYNGKTRH